MIHHWYVLFPVLLALNFGLLRVDLGEAQYRVINWERLRARRSHPGRKETDHA